MNSMKTLALAAVTVLSLGAGAGAAMAQEQGGPSFAPTTQSIPALPSATAVPQGLQFGSSDAAHGEDLGMRAFDAYNSFAGGN